jgi:hypothetical protein
MGLHNYVNTAEHSGRAGSTPGLYHVFNVESVKYDRLQFLFLCLPQFLHDSVWKEVTIASFFVFLGLSFINIRLLDDLYALNYTIVKCRLMKIAWIIYIG